MDWRRARKSEELNDKKNELAEGMARLDQSGDWP
jgi:hypothetical protein